MPRPFLKDRCDQCRRRKIKCDGQKPECLCCQRASRPCIWSSGPRRHHQTRLEPAISGHEFVSSKNPEQALQIPLVARIFRHYIAELASWYDLNDAKRHFSDVVPVCARQSPLLLSAILAFSAASQNSPENGDGTFLRDLTDAYHLECVQALLELTKKPEVFRTGNTLASICLLRSYEIITQNVSCQNHLRGSRSVLDNQPEIMNAGLLTAGFWNYLREDITVALIQKRSLMMDLSTEDLPLVLDGDDAFANRITYILGKIINYCLREDGTPLKRNEWENMMHEVESWKSILPASFNPISTAGPNEGSQFPYLWSTNAWHTAGLQYYHTAKIILYLVEPQSTTLNTLQRMDHISAFEESVNHHATLVCALALSSNSAAVWVNSFGPISFCGRWINDPQARREVIDAMVEWSKKTGWPVHTIVNLLEKS